MIRLYKTLCYSVDSDLDDVYAYADVHPKPPILNTHYLYQAAKDIERPMGGKTSANRPTEEPFSIIHVETRGKGSNADENPDSMEVNRRLPWDQLPHSLT